MVLGILQFDLVIPGSESLKDKRRVIRSVKDRLHREHLAAIAEVGLLDRLDVARLGLALVGSDGLYIGQTLDRIIAKLTTLPDAQLGGVFRQVVHGTGGIDSPSAMPVPVDADEIAREMLARAGELAFLDEDAAIDSPGSFAATQHDAKKGIPNAMAPNAPSSSTQVTGSNVPATSRFVMPTAFPFNLAATQHIDPYPSNADPSHSSNAIASSNDTASSTDPASGGTP